MNISIDNSTTHFQTYPGSGGRPNPICGIADKAGELKVRPHLGFVWTTSIHESQVTCDFCKVELAKEAEPVCRREFEDRVVNMTFHNGTDEDQIEKAIERGIRAGLGKVKDDFFNSESVQRHLISLVEDGVARALQSGTVRQNLVGIHKIADDEIEAEYRDSGDKADSDEKWEADVRRIMREVLDEAAPDQTGAGVGTQYVINNHPPEPVTAQELWLANFKGEVSKPGTTVINVTAEVEPAEFRTMVREVLEEFDEDTAEDYEADETALMQKAVASVVTSDEFQDLLKKVVKVSIDEDRQAEIKRQREINEAIYGRLFAEPSLTVLNKRDIPVVKLPVVHRRKIYTSRAVCGAESGEFTPFTRQVTCEDCKASTD